MDRLSKFLLIPTSIATLAGVGLGQMTNVLQPYWPEAPHWVFAFLFWSGAALTFLPLPSWLLWLGWKNKENFSNRTKMFLGTILIIVGCTIAVVGLLIISTGKNSGTGNSLASPSLPTRPSAPSNLKGENQEPLPTFDFRDNAKGVVDQTKILGDAHGVVRASGNSSFTMTKSLIVGDNASTAFPPPLPELIGSSNSEISIRVGKLISDLRAFQVAHDSEQTAIFNTQNTRQPSNEESEARWKKMVDESKALNEKFESDFRHQFGNRPQLFASLLVSKAGGKITAPVLENTNQPDGFERHRKVVSITNGGKLLLYRSLSGPHPAFAIADFLEFALEKADLR